MKIENKLWIYPYGKVWNVLENKLDENKKDCISVYSLATVSRGIILLPEIFKKVPLSTLEGYFVVKKNKSVDKTGFFNGFSDFMSTRYELNRKSMRELEERFKGTFLSFESRYRGGKKEENPC